MNRRSGSVIILATVILLLLFFNILAAPQHGTVCSLHFVLAYFTAMSATAMVIGRILQIKLRYFRLVKSLRDRGTKLISKYLKVR